jgi:hypothetical protein
MDKTLRPVETCKFSAVFVALGLGLAVDVLLVAAELVVAAGLVVAAELLVVAEPLVAVLLLEDAVAWPALGVPRMPPWAVAGTL